MLLTLRNPLRQPAKLLYGRVRHFLGPARPKVFGIGLSRTGTKSLHQALRVLGYHSDHFSTQILRLRDGHLDLHLRRAEAFDALTDVTAAYFFRELDRAFPGSRFVLTLRDPEAWLRSCARHFPPLQPGRWPHGVSKVLLLREAVYGGESFDAERFRAAYAAHMDAVRTHFARRPGDLLELDVTRGDGWSPLCRFLGMDIPGQPFPWANRAGPNSP